MCTKIVKHICLWLLIIILYLVETETSITLDGAQCGQKQCKLNEYCSEFDKTCQSCTSVCDKKSHNFDSPLCTEKCQDYLHELRYGGADATSIKNLSLTVQKLTTLATVALTLVCILLIIFIAAICIGIYIWKHKHFSLDAIIFNFCGKQQQEAASKNHNSTYRNKETISPNLKLDIPSPTVNSVDHSPETTTTSITRRPAEDSTLDYSYDNPAMKCN